MRASLIAVTSLACALAAPAFAADPPPPWRARSGPSPSAPALILPLSFDFVPVSRRWDAREAFRVKQGEWVLVESEYATGLDLAVDGSDRAVALAQAAHRNLVTGEALKWSSLGAGLLWLVELAANTSNTGPAWTTGFAVGMSGLVSTGVGALIGLVFGQAGEDEEVGAVRAYNSDLAAGALHPPRL